MIPILFDENETEFNTNGIGRLADAVSCTVTEERNGIYDLEMVYPMTGRHYSDIERLRIIYAVPSDGKDPQPFEIYRISSPMGGKVAIYAHHISYRLNKVVTTGENVEASATACSQAMQGLIDNAILPTGASVGFSFWTDNVAGASYSQDVPASIRSRLLGTEGSILDQFGGEYEWDKFTVRLWAERGQNNGVTIRYGKNLMDLTQEYNIENTVTGVIPYWKGEENTVTGGINYSKYHSQYPRERIVTVDFTDQFEEEPSTAALNNLAQIYANEHGLPLVSIKVSFVDLAQTEEYKDIIPLSRVSLCDTVTVQYERLGINATAKISKTVYDVLKDRYESVVVGDITPSLAKTLTAGLAQDIETLSTSFVNKLSKAKSDITQEYTEAIINATAWITGSDGFVMAVTDDNGTWKELIFSSSRNMEASSTKILRINNNGIGFSKTGLAGPYTNAWTIDGNLVADFIHGGTLTLGGSGNANGILKIVNSSGQQIGKWDKDGISVDAGTIDASKANVTNINGGNIQTGTVTSTQIGAGAITTGKLAAGAITADKISSGAVTADKINSGAVTADKIAAGTITADEIAAGTITSDRLFQDSDGYASLAKTRINGTLYAAGEGTSLYIRSEIEMWNGSRWKTADSGTWTIDGHDYTFVHGILVERS